MEKVAFYDTKPYDKTWFDRLAPEYDIEINYFESRLRPETTVLADGCKCVCAFVNDEIDKNVIDNLVKRNVGLIAMRCAGYNNVDIKSAQGRVAVVRVPEYSPHAVAEHAMALLLTLNRKIHKAYIRTRDFNFSLVGMCGFDLFGKTAGIIGMGKIGKVFAKLCIGFGMNVLAYDPYPSDVEGVEYTQISDLCKRSDIISLHCPLTKESRHIINSDVLKMMKRDAVLINTSRGSLVDSEALIDALTQKYIGGACLDVYEEESDLFYDDHSDTIVRDEKLALLLSLPNVIVSSHQAFLTKEALEEIARVTLGNIRSWLDGKTINEVK